jgi:hypothetical protein
MKRFAAIVLPAIFSLGLAACSDDDGPDARVSQPPFPDAPLAPTPDAPAPSVDARTFDAGGAAVDAASADAT